MKAESILPWLSTTLTFSSFKPSTLDATMCTMPRTWSRLIWDSGLRVKTTEAVVGFSRSVKSSGSGITIWTRASSTSDRLRMVRCNSPSRARLKFTFWVKSVMPNFVSSKSSNPTPPPRGNP